VVAPNTSAQNTGGKAPTTVAQTQSTKPQPAEELPAFVPAPKSMVSDRSAAEVAVVNSGAGGTQNAVLTSQPTAIETSASSGGSRIARLSLMPGDDTLKVGDKRRLAIELNSDVPLSLAVLGLKFNPSVVKVSLVSYGTLFSVGKAPSLMHSIDPSGVCLISISTNGNAPMKGSGAMLFIQVEALAPGDAAIAFDKSTIHLVANDSRDVVLELVQGRTTVK
jgi:hypothetical protein